MSGLGLVLFLGGRDANGQHATGKVVGIPAGRSHRTKERREIVIARNGRPAAKLVAIDTATSDKRIGVAKGLFAVPDDIDAHSDEVATLFLGGKGL